MFGLEGWQLVLFILLAVVCVGVLVLELVILFGGKKD